MERLRWLLRLLLVLLVSVPSVRFARAQDGGATPGSCIESVPEGVTRPTLVERVPSRAKAGELVELEIAVRHAAGETATLPADLPSQLRGEVRLAYEGTWGRGEAPLSAPDPADRNFATTVLKVPLVVLSTSLMRATFTIPAVRVIVLRRGGGDLSVCTSAHAIEVDLPTANTPDPQVRANPPTQPQITRDERLYAIVSYSLLALVVGALLAALVLLWLRRPRPVKPPPPPPPPWETAYQRIRSARRDYEAGYIPLKTFFDSQSDAIRWFLGATFGFDGLEMTTDEVLLRLRKLPTPLLPYDLIRVFLYDCDLVKFANVTVGHEACLDAARAAENIVATIVDSRGNTRREPT